MNENSFEWFRQQSAQAREQINSWPDWMKNSLEAATATFPSVQGDEVPPASSVKTSREGDNASSETVAR